MAVWNPKIECAKRSDIEAIQLERLKWSVQHAYDHVPMYHDKMVKAGVKPRTSARSDTPNPDHQDRAADSETLAVPASDAPSLPAAPPASPSPPGTPGATLTRGPKVPPASPRGRR